MENAKLDKYKQKLLESKAEILHELEIEREYFVYNDQGDLVDLADGIINNEVLSKLSDMDVEKLKLIDKALEKVDAGTYGICEGTGKKIPDARLNAIPWAQYTIEHAQQLEKLKKP
jgi:DnaK suppressor protein